ncbi:hypothetical protein AB205_0111250 [Aquarana catesbeiana]|uniref:Uncharacterized protein n=1 Tax=Aquarana catesbeiana TaxID=8400 RepID=A0A2G9Q836_AQUCT|nr:hypothetical protein AB205_0111250 [Aquarana catesbeiana]
MIVIDDAKTTTMSLFLTQGSLSQEVAGPSRLPDIQVPTLHLQRQSGRKMSNLEEAAIGLFWKATEALRSPHSPTTPPPPPPGPTPPPATTTPPQPQRGRKRGRKTRE